MKSHYKKICISDIENKMMISYKANLIIYTPIINFYTFLPIFLMSVSIWLFIKDISLYLLLSVFLFLVSFYRLWVSYEPVKIIRINFTDNCFLLSSRNPISFLLKKKNKLFFKDIKKFFVKEFYFVGLEQRFIIVALLKDTTEIYFTQSLNETRANKIAEFLSSFLIIS